MKVKISAHHVSPEEKLQQFITEKVSKLEHFDENLAEAEVVLSLERSGSPNYESKIVKIKLFGRNGDYFAEKRSGTFEDATMQVIDALRRQILKSKDRRR